MIIKRFILLVALIACIGAGKLFAQNPLTETKVWKASMRVEHPFDELILTPIDPEKNQLYAYYRVEFTSDSTFSSFNIPGCGMDCVIYSFGSYSLMEDKVQLSIDSTHRFKACWGDSVLSQNLGTYYLVKDAYGIRFLKSLKDEPKADYFQALNLEIPIFEEEEANELILSYAYLYNRLFAVIANKNVEKYPQFNNEIHVWSTNSRVYSYSVVNEQREAYAKYHEDLDKKIRDLLLELKD